MNRLPRDSARLKILRLFLLVPWFAWVAPAAELLPPGFRPLPLGVHALVGARIVIKPGEELASGTVVIRNGRIEAVGTEITAPADARIWPMQGLTLYAGFIETYLPLSATNIPVSTFEAFPVNESTFAAAGAQAFYGAPGTGTDPGTPGPGHSSARITPEFRVLDRFAPKSEMLKSLRELGFTTALVVPGTGILRGHSSVIALAEDNPNRVVLKHDVFQHIAFDTTGNESGAYPASLMGVIAAIRQTFLDAHHYALDRRHFESASLARPRPEFNPSLESLQPVIQGRRPVVFEPGSALMNDRAAQLARELGVQFVLVSCGEEWRRPDRIQHAGAAFIVPVNFPSLPKLPEESDWTQISLDQLRAWDWAPENPAVIHRAGMDIALTTYALTDKKAFRKNVRLALDRGFNETNALAALTTIPARLIGLEQQLGTVEPGKLANLVAVEGNYFAPESKVHAVWIEGRIYPVDTDKSARPKRELPSPVALQEPDAAPPKEEPEEHPKPPGTPDAVSSIATNLPASAQDPPAEEKPAASGDQQKHRTARSPLEGRGPLATPSSLLIRNATVWTSGPQGILTNAHVLISNGKIQQVEQGRIEVTPETHIIDGAGLHITPGIVDCHSHAAILGNANETGSPSTAMVRIRDVVNSESENLYRQLAGGVTTIHLLHGSANPIGGQSCVIKLREGAPPDELLFDAPAGIKFALGENVKQANWGDRFTTRFPQSRMGVRTFLQNRFVAARHYRDEWNAYRAATNNPANPNATTAVRPPRRDLELEALAEILDGQRWIHCHAYRQDEMLMFTRLMQEFGVQVGTFQHALEAYKIADELAAANIGVSSFSDWWGYKVELFDSIPYNGSLCHDRNVLVSFNSDFSELARRLYLEAAKAVKYGGVPPEQALRFVTINPARQLRIDHAVGSIEPGKDADFAVWSRSPLDSGTVCLETWIEGKKYFDRARDAERMEQLVRERTALLAKAKSLSEKATHDAQSPAGGKSFFHVSLEHQHDSEWRCLHE